MFLMMSSSVGSKVVKGTIIIVAVGILAKVSSFVAEAILAAFLGTTFKSDAYYMVSSIQAVIYPMLSVGIWKVFLPIYKEKISLERHQEADALTNKTITFFSIISILFVVFLIVFAGPVVSIVAPGFHDQSRDLCIRLVKLSAPMYFFIIAAAIYASVLQANNKFFGSQIREVVSHIPTIVAAVFLYREFGIEVMAIALVVGGAIRLLVELPFVNWGYSFKPNFHFRDSDFRLLLSRIPSAFLSEGATQINILVDKAMASTLIAGTISALNYGQKLMNVFSGLLSTAITTALYPQIIELIALEKEEELSNLISKTINVFIIIMLPVSFACILFRTELVSVVFQRGSFDEYSTYITSNVFALYSIGLLFIAINTMINSIMYAFGNTTTPLKISVVNLIVNVSLNLALIHYLGANGLALASSLAALITMIVTFVLLKKFVIVHSRAIINTGFKTIIASVFACFLPRILFWRFPINSYWMILISASSIILLYFFFIKVLKVKELDLIISIFKNLKRSNTSD